MLDGFKVLKQIFARNIVKWALIVVKLIISTAAYQYLLKKGLIAFVR